MKNIVLTLLTGLLLSLTALAQNYTVSVYGTVMIISENNVIPVPGQAVIITIDSSNTGFTYQNTVYTDQSGYYEDVVSMPNFSGYEYVQAMTFDSCQGQYLYEGQAIIPGATLTPMDFYLCNTAPPQCQAFFYYYQTDPADPYTFSFVNQSIGNYTQVIWNFGDSTFSDEAFPIHTFPGPGAYNVCLTIYDSTYCNSTYCEMVYTGGGWNGCENYFVYNFNNNDPSTLTFEGFLSNGQYAQSYWWDFGDGTTGEGQTVTHTYIPGPGNVGIYMVGLSTMVMDSINDSCFYTSYQEVFIQNQSGCESFIIPTNLSGLTVDFEGYTISQYETEYTWEFGDGVTGTGQFVTHTFPSAGMYTVVLQTIDATGCTYQSFTQIWLDSQNQGCSNYFTYEQLDSTSFTFTGVVYMNNGTTIPDSTSVYMWDFGDGTTGTGQTITHTFQENPVNNYTVCLTTTTIINGVECSASYCEGINVVTPIFSIYGSVYLGNNQVADQAIIHLMIMDTLMQNVIEVQSTTIDSGGYYLFSDLPMYNTRLYFVQAELTEGSIYFGQYLPTYHINSMTWEEATPILPLMNWPADIFMIAGNTVEGGNGTITGIVSDLGTRGMMNNVEVILMDGDSNPLTYLRSDEQGSFSFDGLAFGTYTIHAEIMGIHTIQAQVTLSAEHPAANVEVQVSGGEANIVFGVPEQKLTLDKVGDIYPNPATDASKLEITIKKPVNIEVSIFGQTGQLMDASEISLNAGTHNIEVEMGSLPAGLYLLRITTAQGEMVSRKFMKAR